MSDCLGMLRAREVFYHTSKQSLELSPIFIIITIFINKKVFQLSHCPTSYFKFHFLFFSSRTATRYFLKLYQLDAHKLIFHKFLHIKMCSNRAHFSSADTRTTYFSSVLWYSALLRRFSRSSRGAPPRFSEDRKVSAPWGRGWWNFGLTTTKMRSLVIYS